MKESPIENKLRIHIESKNGMCRKFVSPGWNGAPDRICLLPDSKIIFVETKATGKKARPLQAYRHKQLRNLGFEVRVIDSEEQIYEI